MQGTPPPSPSSAGQTDDWISSCRPNPQARWSARLGLAANGAWLIYSCSGQLTFGREERYVPAMLVESLVLALCCLVASIAAIRLGILGRRRARLPATAGRGRAIAGIALGSLGLLWVLIMLVQTADIAIVVKGFGPKSVDRLQCAEHLRAIGKACEQYASENDGRYPDEFIKLHTECGLATNTLFCGCRSYPRTVTTEEVIEVTDWGMKGAFIYAGAGLNTGVAPDTVLVYERLKNHEWGIHVLYADGRVEWLNEERAEELIAAMQPKPPASGPTTRP